MVAIHDSFGTLTEAEFKAYSTELMGGYPSSAERKHAVAYLQQVASADKANIDTQKAALRTTRKEHRAKQAIIDTLVAEQGFDYTRQTALFVQQAPTDAELRAILTQDNAECFFSARTIAGDVEITGDSVLFDGGGSGDARTETLASTGKVTGDLIISGDDATIRGVDFTSGSIKAIRFAAGVEDVKFENCLFKPGAGVTGSAPYDGTMWWFGDGFQGNVTVTNCFVTGFSSWLLADFGTGSATPALPLKRVRVKKNYFKNCGGSIAARGMASNPTKLVQYQNNKYISDTTHTLFWDCFEANNAKRVVVSGNEASIAGQGDKRGFLQAWSRSSLPWSLYYKGNTPLTNFKVAGKVAHNSTFYAPDAEDEEDFLIDLTGTYTNVAHGFSFVYKKEDGTTPSASKWQEGDYVPENATTYPAPPVAKVVNPGGFNIVVS